MPRKGHKFTPEQKKRMSESHKGKKPWNKGKKGLQVAWNKDMKGYTNAGTFKKGHSQSDEAKKKMSVAKKGISLSKEHRKNISQGNKGKKIPRDVRMKISEKNRGKKRSEEAKKKMSVAKKGKPSPMKGKTGVYSEETLKKMSLKKILHYKRNPEALEKLKLTSFRKGNQSWNKGKTGVYSEEVLQKIRRARAKQVFPLKDTKPEKHLQSLLRDKKIKFETHRNFVKKGTRIYGQPDIFIKPNICIFVDGDYWHCNPNDYVYRKKLIPGFKSNDQITGKKYAKEKWAKDKGVNDKLKKGNYTVLRFWQSELESDPEKCIKKFLKTIKA